MQFLKNIFTSIKSNLSIVSLSVLAIVLILALAYQFIDYNNLRASDNNEAAIKSGQRVVIDLKDKKWFEAATPTGEVVMEDIKFSADGNTELNEDVAIEDEDDEPSENSSSSADNTEDDAFRRKQSDDEDKKDETEPAKPSIKVFEKPALNESMSEVSIIISNLGLNERAIKSASMMDGDYTMSFTPYGQLTTKASVQMAEEGRTVLAELPMQSTADRNDAGKFALSPTFDDQKNIQNFEAVYSIIPSAIGFMTPTDEDFSGTGGNEALDKILKLIQDKDAAVVYQGKTTRKVREFAAVNGLEAIIPDLTIDTQPTAENIEAQLRALETIALERGSAVGIAHPYPITFDILKKWQETLSERKIKLVSAVQR